MPHHLEDHFHGSADLTELRPSRGASSPLDAFVGTETLSYKFSLHMHPWVTELVKRLNRGSVRGLEDADTANPPLVNDAANSFEQRYAPTGLVELPHPVEDLDFNGAYAVYNWEVFFHVPLAVAIHLSQNHRFQDAQRWFHYIFDPTDDSEGPTPDRFWKVKPLRGGDVEMIQAILVNLASGADRDLQQRTIDSITAWRKAPFRPHVVARYRPTAYMLKTLMAYLDNLIAWGDSQFAQDTGESINEATQLYVLAANILGPRPQLTPRKAKTAPQTYATLRNNLDAFSNALRQLEADLPLDTMPSVDPGARVDRAGTIRGLGKDLYFCVPRNDKLLGYWDTMADRLFKIRNSLNLQGVFRQLPLFEPPIDPGLLARAAASGLDIGAVVSGLNQPLPLVRFQFLVQKAVEICQEVKSLGNNLLAAMEKRDNEALTLLRARHERALLGLGETVRYAQLQEAIKAREGLEQSLANAAQRYTYYERLLGKQESDIKIPGLDALDTSDLEGMKFKSDEPTAALRPIDVDIAQGVEGLAGALGVSTLEQDELNLLWAAHSHRESAGELDLAASAIELATPMLGALLAPLGVGPQMENMAKIIGKSMGLAASWQRLQAEDRNWEATRVARVGGWNRRAQEWAFQSNAAAGEIALTLKQLRAAQIREYIAEREWKNHQQQIKNANEIELFLTDEQKGHKKTTEALYLWMQGAVKALYGQCFQLAFEVARKAERALQHELGAPGATYIQSGYLAGKEGLLAGEKLHLDLKRMEMAYHDQNRREYELTKHVSLRQVDPIAFLTLRETGSCTVRLPEALFDLDCPGQYFRRIRSVALSIPCVAGPYASVNCRLSLTRSTIRRSPALRDGVYARDLDNEDDRFSDYLGSMPSVVTSTAQNDSGLFETNLRDERYLPFEGSGVIGTWKLELLGDPPQFDHSTITDAVLHLRYTAREGGEGMRGQVTRERAEELRAQAGTDESAGSVRLFSLRREFPTEWAAFTRSPPSGQVPEIKVPLDDTLFPFWAATPRSALKRLDLFVKWREGAGAKTSRINVEVGWKGSAAAGSGAMSEGAPIDALERWTLPELPTAEPAPTAPLAVDDLKFRFGEGSGGGGGASFDPSSVDDLWLAVTWMG